MPIFSLFLEPYFPQFLTCFDDAFPCYTLVKVNCISGTENINMCASLLRNTKYFNIFSSTICFNITMELKIFYMKCKWTCYGIEIIAGLCPRRKCVRDKRYISGNALSIINCITNPQKKTNLQLKIAIIAFIYRNKIK